jgi:hypothetical protein
MPKLILALLLCFLSLVSSQVQVTPISYQVTQPTFYIGGGDCIVNGMILNCEANDLLTDDVTDIGAPFDIDNFMGWNKNFTLKFDFGSRSFEFAQIDIYFYNNPSAGYGLPAINTEISFSGLFGLSNRILTTFIDNSEFSRTDEGVDMVSLVVVTRVQFTRFLVLNFVLNDYAITETVISEIQVFTGTSLDVIVSDPIVFQMPNQSIRSGPDVPTPSLQMSCTITNNGTFSWTWAGPAVNTDRALIQFADLSRTSILTISRISSEDAGIYTCTAGYPTNVLIDGVPVLTQISSSNISLLLIGSVNPSDTSILEYIGNNVTVHCTFYGYLPVNFEITWRKDGRMSLDDAPGDYIISDFDANGNSQNGGSSIDSGIRSELVIVSSDAIDSGRYTCEMNGTDLLAAIQVTITPSPSPSSSSLPTNDPTSTPASSDIVPIVAGVVVPVVVLLLLLIVVIIIIVCIVKNNRKGSATLKNSLSHDSLYAELSKPAPPPLPSRILNSGYAVIDLPKNPTNEYSMSALKVPESERISLVDVGQPTPAQISARPDYLQNNPMYASSDRLDKEPTPNGFSLHQAPSLPYLDSEDQPDSGAQFNIYAKPSTVAPPVPSYHGTPDPEDVEYMEEGFDPDLFRRASSIDSDPRNSISVSYYPIYNNPKPLQRSEDVLLEVKEKNIREIRELGMGQFGVVALSHTVGLSLKQLGFSDTSTETNVSLVVAIKRLKDEADDKMREAFEREVKFMARLKHDNVVRLLGVCLSQNAFIMMEYMENGDLNHYLKMQEFTGIEIDDLPENKITVPILIYMCMQISRGMRYLASLRFIHRDLATRNILVGQDHKVKIADFGMSHNLYSDVYYRIQGRAVLPIRWMASECFYGHFSEKTDVWSFGVLMWEVFTLCRCQPYENMSDQEIIDDAVKREKRLLLPCPEICPNDVYEAMLRCWIYPPENRANFEQIYDMLSNIHAYNEYS